MNTLPNSLVKQRSSLNYARLRIANKGRRYHTMSSSNSSMGLMLEDKGVTFGERNREHHTNDPSARNPAEGHLSH
jgi:hypothetical protein